MPNHPRWPRKINKILFLTAGCSVTKLILSLSVSDWKSEVGGRVHLGKHVYSTKYGIWWFWLSCTKNNKCLGHILQNYVSCAFKGRSWCIFLCEICTAKRLVRTYIMLLLCCSSDFIGQWHLGFRYMVIVLDSIGQMSVKSELCFDRMFWMSALCMHG